MDARSEANLAQVRPRLADVIRAAAQSPQQFEVTYGVRTLQAERQALASGHSTTEDRTMTNAMTLTPRRGSEPGPRPANAFAAGPDLAARPPTPEPPTPVDADPHGEALGARLASLSAEQKGAAARQAELLGAVGQGLAGIPYAERAAVLAHMAPALAARGMPIEAIRAFDPTDANLEETRAAAASLGRLLAAA